MQFVLIRHFATRGNQIGRYIGTTDEDLAKIMETVDLANYPAVKRIYASPLRRCIQTAKVIYPDQEPILCEQFRECDFGLFENKNYQELSGVPQYQEWVDSGGTISFPEGEDPIDFRKRCIEEFVRVVQDCIKDGIQEAAIIAHGGTIMSIMEAFDQEAKSFYDYQVRNGLGFVVKVEGQEWLEGKKSLKLVKQLD